MLRVGVGVGGCFVGGKQDKYHGGIPRTDAKHLAILVRTEALLRAFLLYILSIESRQCWIH